MRPCLGSVGRLAGLIVAVAVAGCAPKRSSELEPAPPLDGASMDQQFDVLADAAVPARLGAAVLSLTDGQSWAFAGERRFPLGEVAHMVIAAAALAEVEAGRLHPAETLTIREQDLSPPPSLVAETWPARTAYSVDALLELAVAGDNTAADVLMKRIGGPGAVGGWLQAKNLTGVSIDRYMRQLAPETAGLADFRPGWRGQAAYVAALAKVPPPQRGAALTRRLADPRDTATPQGMAAFLAQLNEGELLAPAASGRLRGLLARNAPPGRIAASLPPGARFTGAAGTPPTAAEAGLVELADGRRYAVAVFVAGPPLEPKRRKAVAAGAARAVLAGLR